ncbi:MAG: hypothetical protein ACI84C_002550 [Flavobacteriales bacterium]|jgi:hypothetical protein
MKKWILTLAVAAFTLSSFAQIAHDLEIYSEDGLKFTLILNGRVMNEAPASNIQILNTNKDYLNAKIKFEDDSMEDITRKNLQLAHPGTDQAKTNTPVSVVYKIVEKKGKYKLKFASRSDKKIQPKETVIIQEGNGSSNGIEISNGKVVVRW